MNSCDRDPSNVQPSGVINIILEDPNASNAIFTEQAIELNKGLSFTDGQWIPTE